MFGLGLLAGPDGALTDEEARVSSQEGSIFMNKFKRLTPDGDFGAGWNKDRQTTPPFLCVQGVARVGVRK